MPQVGKSVDEQVQEQSQDLLDKMPQELVEEVFRAQIHKKDGLRGTNVAWYLNKLRSYVTADLLKSLA